MSDLAVDARPNAYEADIDTKLADLWEKASKLRYELARNKETMARAVGIKPEKVGRRREIRTPLAEIIKLAEEKAKTEDTSSDYSLTYFAPAARALKDRVELEEKLAAVRAEAAPLEAIYDAKRWSRFFLVMNANGHIHESMECSTCFWDTRFSWLPELSGLTEKDAVAGYGTRLCSVCFPTAPVEWTLGITKPVDPDLCEGSGTYDHDSSGIRYYSPRAKCNHCGNTVSVTSTGKMRKHKKVAK